jgi:hypothetical protein
MKVLSDISSEWRAKVNSLLVLIAELRDKPYHQIVELLKEKLEMKRKSI